MVCKRELKDNSLMLTHADAEFLAKLKTSLSPEGRENAFIPDVHILLAVRWPQQEYRTVQQKPVIDGACVFEYHPENNCGLLTTLLQQRKNRVDGLDVLLVETTLEILNQRRHWKFSIKTQRNAAIWQDAMQSFFKPKVLHTALHTAKTLSTSHNTT
jgi:hypothetical protein